MRIVGGRFRGTQLATPPPGERTVRPTADRVRESVFNLLAHRPEGNAVAGARVLDLFAGTGALGLEALSRGAARAVFVENGRAAVLVAANIDRIGAGGIGAGDAARLIRRDATRLGPCPEEMFDLVFLDPPYGRGLGEKAVASALAGGWIAPGALILWEESAPPLPPPGLTHLDTRRYGEAMISLFRLT